MNDVKPYLIRAFYDWIGDSGLTAYMVVDCTINGVVVPDEYHNQKDVALNISQQAVKNLSLANDNIVFDARFNSKYYNVILPMVAINGIYAQENNQGMWFNNAENKKEFVREFRLSD